MHRDLRDLKAVAPAPILAGASADWGAVEAALGVQLPADYKRLVAEYAGVPMGGFLWLLYPSANTNLDLLAQQRVRLAALRELSEGVEPAGHPLETLIAWAITDNGDVCYWLAAPRDSPERWTCAVNAGREPKWEYFEGCATQFLVAVFRGTFQSSIFPSDFPASPETQ